ncbi:unnamed protein product [Leptidea sinapis]|uniref:Uncharacterized protein n=1 Tax=Leptidea sinapis TaxID=189913 RepID=A0A5E4R3I7_9NEOP|nr:unnamed protein product [Leptidea sinapis]
MKLFENGEKSNPKIMGRVKATIRKKGRHTAQSMKKSLELVKAVMSIRQASKECNLKYPTRLTLCLARCPSPYSSHTLEDIENRQGEKSASPSLLNNVDAELNDSNEDKEKTISRVQELSHPKRHLHLFENNNPRRDSPDGPDSLKQLNSDRQNVGNPIRDVIVPTAQIPLSN